MLHEYIRLFYILLPTVIIMAWSTAASASKDADRRPTASLSYPLVEERDEYHGRGIASRSPHDSSFLQLVDQRVSVREFQSNIPIDDGIIVNALRVARLAPSAGNRQAYQVVVVDQVEQKRALAQAALHQEWIANAPVVLVFLADEERSASKYHDRGRYLYAVQDATIAAAYTQLALEAAGLASCWVGAFYEDEVADIVGAPLNDNNGEEEQVLGILRPVILMPVGVAAEHPKRHRRRAIKDFVHHGHVNSPFSHEEATEGRARSTFKRKANEDE